MRKGGQIDNVILGIVSSLTIFGLVALASASSDLGKLRFDDAYYYLSHQITLGLGIGIVGFLFGLFINYKIYKKFAPLILIVSLGTLLLTLTPLGFAAGGAKRWLALGPIIFQPAELFKIAFVFYMSAWLGGIKNSKRLITIREGLMPFLIIIGLVGFFFIFQHSTSAAAITILSALAIYFVSGVKKRYLVYIFGLAGIAVTLFTLFTPYRAQRVLTFLDPSSDAQGAGYQLNQALTTIGSGGLTGVGYGKSLSKTYLPERIGDSIFAIIAEEWGFVGAIALIIVFFVLVAKIFLIARNISDEFAKLVLTGFGTILGAQVFIHIGSNLGLIPFTGVPLPYISYGGTALAVYLTMTGVILNIAKNS